MENIIIYGSRYKSARIYAKKLSEQTGVPAVPYTEAPSLTDKGVIVYIGGLYAGGVTGLAKTLRGLTLQDGQKLIIVTVGVSDPQDPENRENIRAALGRQLPAALLGRAKIHHLRGGIDYQHLSAGHRMIMALLYRSLRRIPAEKQTEENRALIETYGKCVDFTDFGTLEPVIRDMNG